MYRDFLTAMKGEGVTSAQIGNLLGCRYQTVSDAVDGGTKESFYHENAVMIRNVLFPKYDLDYLFQREKQCVNKHMLDESSHITITCVCQWEKKGGCGE